MIARLRTDGLYEPNDELARSIAEAAHRGEGCPCAGDLDECEFYVPAPIEIRPDALMVVRPEPSRRAPRRAS